MPHNVEFHQGLHCLLRQKWSSGEKLQFCWEIKTCDPLNYTMDHSKFIASIQKDEFISSFKSYANYYIQHQSLNYMYDEIPNLVNFVLLSLTESYLQQIMQVSCKKHTCYGKFLWSLFLLLILNGKNQQPMWFVVLWTRVDRHLGQSKDVYL